MVDNTAPQEDSFIWSGVFDGPITHTAEFDSALGYAKKPELDFHKAVLGKIKF